MKDCDHIFTDGMLVPETTLVRFECIKCGDIDAIEVSILSEQEDSREFSNSGGGEEGSVGDVICESWELPEVRAPAGDATI